MRYRFKTVLFLTQLGQGTEIDDCSLQIGSMAALIGRDLLSLADFSPQELQELLQLATQLKSQEVEVALQQGVGFVIL